MKFSTILAYVFCTGLMYGQNDLTGIKHHGTNPGNLEMFIHIPESHNDSVRKPLLVVLHGCSQSAEMVARQSGWNKLADYYDFYVLYPQQKFLNNSNRCFNWFREDDILKNKGEVYSIKEMVDFAVDTFLIDTTKLFIYGLSAGAAMSVALMADYPDMFNAGAILAGGPFMSASNAIDGLVSMTAPKNKTASELAEPVIAQNPGYKNKYPRMILVHGKGDPVVNIKNSYQLIQQWTYLHQTDTIADSTIHSFAKHRDIVKYIYRDTLNHDVVIFYEVNDLGHAVMIDPGNEITKGGETGIFAVDKNFFSTYWIALDFGLISNTDMH